MNTRLKESRITLARVCTNGMAGVWALIGSLLGSIDASMGLWLIPIAILGQYLIGVNLSKWVERGDSS